MVFLGTQILFGRPRSIQGLGNSSIMRLVCGSTMCVSTCQVEFVLRELSFFILLPRSRFIGCSGDFSVLKRTVLLFNYYPGGRYRKLAGTTTLAYRIVINCTTAESVLELVSTFRLACSSHRQETNNSIAVY